MSRTQPIRLGMSLLVRDEADIIEENICYHAAQGVDQFVVMDNGSVDGTREILESLKSRVELHIIDQTEQTMDQDRWVTQMAQWLRQSGHANWVVNNDADEFWLCDNGSLPEAISNDLTDSGLTDVGVMACERFNYLPSLDATQAAGYRFYHNHLKVISNLESGDKGAAKGATTENVLITLQGEKVATRLDGLNSIGMGNHAAKHSGSVANSKRITIAHYPLRTFDQFRKKVVNHGSSILGNTRFGAQINWHLRFWYECYQQGTLEAEYRKYAISADRQIELLKAGVLQTDTSLRQRLGQFDVPASGGQGSDSATGLDQPEQQSPKSSEITPEY